MHPRALLVTSSVFNAYSGGGITLSNLFKGWPSDRIAILHTDNIVPDETICRRQYQLQPAELGWIWPLNLLADRTPRALAEAPQAAGGRAWARLPRSLVGRAARRILATVVGDEGLQDQVRVSRTLQQWVEDFRPEVIYTFLGSLGFVRLVGELVARTGAPVVVHMMDDWPTARYRQGFLGAFFRQRVDHELRPLLGSAAARLAISEPMCRAFAERYGLPFRAFHNALDLSSWLPESRSDWGRQGVLQLLYSGSIEPQAQLESLRDVAEAVGELLSEGMSVELRIRSPRHYLHTHVIALERGPAVRLEPPPEPEEVARILAEADILVLPVNFNRQTIEYVRYSFPTKIPAYLASGTPILAYGPPEVAQIALAQEQGWALVVDRRDRAALKNSIRELASDAGLRERLGRRGQDVARAEHDAERVRPAFQRVLVEAARRFQSDGG